MSVIAPPSRKIFYPSSDGKPMADNTVQFRWIAILKWNLEHQYDRDPNVFVAGDHLIYPVEGKPQVWAAPDTHVAFGPKKGDRGCYKVWEEGGVFPQVVFEVWSPGNRFAEMEEKREFYETYGAEEYYIVYPEKPGLEGWLRGEHGFEPVEEMNGFTSPRLDIRFVLDDEGVHVFGADGREFQTPNEIAGDRDRVMQDRDRVMEDRDRLLRDRDRLAAKLRELGIDPDGI